MECAIPAGLDVRLDPFGLDPAAVLQHDRHLPREEGPVRVAAPRPSRSGGAVQGCDDRVGFLGPHPLVERPIRVDLDQRSLAAEPHAADFDHFDALAQARPGRRPRPSSSITFTEPDDMQPAAEQQRMRTGLRPARSFSAISSRSPRSMMLPSFQPFQRRFRLLVAGHLAIVDDDRRQAARAEAAGRAERDPSVRRRLAGRSCPALPRSPRGSCRPP